MGFAQLQQALMFNAFTFITQKNLCCKLQRIQCKSRVRAWIISHVCKQHTDCRDFVILGKKCVHEMLHLPLRRPCWQWPWSNSAIWAGPCEHCLHVGKSKTPSCVKLFHKSSSIPSSGKGVPLRQFAYTALSARLSVCLWKFQLSINRSKTCLSLEKKELKSKSRCTQLNKDICVGSHEKPPAKTNRHRNTRGEHFYNFLSCF